MATMSDLFQKKKFKVLACDFEGAVPSVHHNPTARAICRALGKPLGSVGVWIDCIQIGPRYYRAPAEVNHQDTRFTGFGTVEPYEFVMSNEPIEPVLTVNQKPPPKRR